MTAAERYRSWFTLARSRYLHLVIWPAVFGAQTTTNALNTLREARRNGLPFRNWEPFAWEYTSFASSLLGAAVVITLHQWARTRSKLIRIASAAAGFLGFFVVHVGLMVPARQALYAALGRRYDFGDWAQELPYEARKDVLTVMLVLGVCWLVDLLRDLAARPGGPKYARSGLDEGEQQRLLERIESAARQRFVHRDPNLTLARLARAVGASPNHVSQVLNQHAGGFHAWLAEKRVADARSLLLQDNEVSGLLDAAYTVGFNSKSAFYSAFRKSTGLTPGAWREEQRRLKA